jgi:hypothetical protein
VDSQLIAPTLWPQGKRVVPSAHLRSALTVPVPTILVDDLTIRLCHGQVARPDWNERMHGRMACVGLGGQVASQESSTRSASPLLAALEPSLPQWLRVLLGVLGGASFGAGAVALFMHNNGTGTGVLIGFGGILLVLALLGDRIQSLEFGSAKLKLATTAAVKYAQADRLARQGDHAAAEQLRAEARALVEAVGPIASSYGIVRETMPPGPARTQILEQLVASARRKAKEQAFDAGEVSRQLREGSDQERITAIALMQEDSRLRDFDGALAAIKDPRSHFEQYHALLLLREMLYGLNADQKQRLADTVREVNQHLEPGGDRMFLSTQILTSLERGSGG